MQNGKDQSNLLDMIRINLVGLPFEKKSRNPLCLKETIIESVTRYVSSCKWLMSNPRIVEKECNLIEIKAGNMVYELCGVAEAPCTAHSPAVQAEK